MSKNDDAISEHDKAYREQYKLAKQMYQPEKMTDNDLKDKLRDLRNDSHGGGPSTHQRIARIYVICDEMAHRGIGQEMIGDYTASKEYKL